MPQLKWIGVRSERRGQVNALDEVVVDSFGLVGDHYSKEFEKRNVTLIREEGLQEVWNKLGREGDFDPTLSRRNLIVSGLPADLKKMNGDRIRIGDQVELEVTGYCFPCTRMDENFGEGGLAAMNGHGGLTARVVEMGSIKIGDEITVTKFETVS